MVASKHATLYELQSAYGVRDLFDLVEVITVESFNARRANETE